MSGDAQLSGSELISKVITPPRAMSSCLTMGTCTSLPLMSRDLIYGFCDAPIADITRGVLASGRSIITLSKNGLVRRQEILFQLLGAEARDVKDQKRGDAHANHVVSRYRIDRVEPESAE